MSFLFCCKCFLFLSLQFCFVASSLCCCIFFLWLGISNFILLWVFTFAASFQFYFVASSLFCCSAVCHRTNRKFNIIVKILVAIIFFQTAGNFFSIIVYIMLYFMIFIFIHTESERATRALRETMSHKYMDRKISKMSFLINVLKCFNVFYLLYFTKLLWDAQLNIINGVFLRK